MSITKLMKVIKISITMKYTQFSIRLRESREEKSLTMKQLAAAIEVSDASICKWENALAEPKAGYILKLAEYFHCSTDYLLGNGNDYAGARRNFCQISLDSGERELVELFKGLPEIQKRLLLATARAWTEAEDEVIHKIV